MEELYNKRTRRYGNVILDTGVPIPVNVHTDTDIFIPVTNEEQHFVLQEPEEGLEDESGDELLDIHSQHLEQGDNLCPYFKPSKRAK